MHRLLPAAVVGSAMLAAPAQACMVSAPLQVGDVAYADLVVTGRIANYHIVRGRGPRPISDYARFEVVVDQVLKGKAGKTVSATWDNSTFAEPTRLPPGRYLVALRRSGARTPPLRGPSATVFPDPERGSMVLLQAPCAPAFMFPATSREAAAVAKVLARR
jgi:hypothetical protein